MRVNDVRWHETEALAGLGPTDRRFITRTDDAAITTVIFGDGEQGARPPTGIENITARTGRPAGEVLEAIKRMSPQNRLVTTEEVAALAVLLASEAGRGINGQAINVDGGSVLF